MADLPDPQPPSPEDAMWRFIASTPIPRNPYCLKCGPVDERIGVMGIGGEFLCPKCGQVLNSRRS
jgi:hypothetical protein